MASQSPAVKHHFWILFFATPLFLGLAFLLMLVFVGITLADAKKDLDATKSGLSAQPKTAGEMDAMTTKVGDLEKDRNTLWKKSYDEQSEAGVFAWPVSSSADFNALAPKRDPRDPDGKVTEMVFGEKFNLVGRATVPPVLKETFERAYSDLEKGNPKTGVKGIAPTRFAGSSSAAGTYLNALRTVTTWGAISLEPEPFWLLLEDYWVQRGLLAPIAKVNADAAEFQPVAVATGTDADLKRSFSTRTWDLDLEVDTKGAKQFLKGELRNRTTRLQPLGVNKAMKVQVWFREPSGWKEARAAKDDKALAKIKWPAPDVLFEIRGESVPGKAALVCSPQEFVTAGSVGMIARAVQVFDEATVPVRLVGSIELGMLDHRNKAATYEMPKHMDGYEWPPEPAGSTTGSDRPGGPGGPGGPAGSVGAGGPGGSVGAGGPGGSVGGGSTGDSGSSAPAAPTGPTGKKFGPPKVVLFDNRMRYVKRTDDVRRMPVAVSVVIDNDYTNDLMVAYTNSPLHFQITQTQWARYKGTLPPVGGGGSAPPPTGPTGGPDGGPDGGRGGTADGGGPGRPGFPGMTGGGGPGMPGGGPGMPGATGSTSGALPGEAGANLVEFALFGVVSLYEKLPEKKDEDKKDGDPMGEPKTDPKTDPKTTPDPMPKPDGEKKDPPADAPKPPADEKKDKEPAPTTPGK